MAAGGDTGVVDARGSAGDLSPQPVDRPVPWARLTVALGAAFGLWAMVVAPFATNLDAVSHLVRVSEISEGRVAQPVDEDGRAFAVIDGCMAAFSLVLNDEMARLQDPERDMRTGILDPNYPAVPCSDPLAWDIGNAALNSPVAYLPALPGYVVGRPFGPATAALLASATTLVGYLALAGAAVRLAPRGKPLLFLVALLPTSLRQASTVSPDAMAIGLSLLVAALVLRLRAGEEGRVGHSSGQPDEATRRLLVGLAAAVVLLGISKNLYASTALTVLLVPRSALASPRRWWRYVAATVGATVAVAGAWALLVANHVRWPVRPLIDADRQRDLILEDPVGFLGTIAHSMGQPLFRHWTLPGIVSNVWADPDGFPRIPGWVQVAALALFVVAVVADAGRPRHRGVAARLRGAGPAVAVVGVVVGVTVVVMYYGEALLFTPVGHPTIGWIEGRFFVPLLPLTALVVDQVSVPRPEAATSPGRRWAVPAGAVALLAWNAGLMAGAYL